LVDRAIQYSETSVIESMAAAYWIPRSRRRQATPAYTRSAGEASAKTASRGMTAEF